MLLVLLALRLSPAVVLAHGGEGHVTERWWAAWSLEPTLLVGLLLGALAYARALGALWKRAGMGRGVRRWQAFSFAGGLLALVVALLSPIDALGEQLFSAHMVQHLLLIVVAAPLLVLGAPPVLWLWALPLQWRREVGRWWKHTPLRRYGWKFLSQPLVVWALYAGILWLWHTPALYQAALESDLVHYLEHVSFLGSALLFWAVLADAGRRGQMGYGAGVLYIFTTGLHSTALGALITFASAPWYPIYAASTGTWGLTPLEDQQLAGLIMWLPVGLIYLLVALLLLAGWIKSAERRVRQREQWERVAAERASG
ncbi:MAG: cytochrome c oxidase assembly protein [Chloroflexota bacterium]|nr:cytochrome c oxidase assembly protein [Chloroflexota bacterium]